MDSDWFSKVMLDERARMANVISSGPVQSMPAAPNYEHPTQLLETLHRRRVSFAGFGHISCHKQGDTVFVFVVTSEGKGLVLEDEWALYPSDNLVTRLRIL